MIVKKMKKLIGYLNFNLIAVNTILKPTHIFRQAQYDIARGQSEPVEACAFAIIILL